MADKFEIGWDNLTVKSTNKKTNDGRQIIEFAEVDATIEREFPPTEKNYFSWSWKFTEDKTMVPNARGTTNKGYFWKQPMVYEPDICEWYEEDGFGTVAVKVTLKAIKGAQERWNTYIDTMRKVDIPADKKTKVEESDDTVVEWVANESKPKPSPKTEPSPKKEGAISRPVVTADATSIRITKGMAFNNLTSVVAAYISKGDTNLSQVVWAGEEIDLITLWTKLFTQSIAGISPHFPEQCETDNCCIPVDN